MRSLVDVNVSPSTRRLPASLARWMDGRRPAQRSLISLSLPLQAIFHVVRFSNNYRRCWWASVGDQCAVNDSNSHCKRPPTMCWPCVVDARQTCSHNVLIVSLTSNKLMCSYRLVRPCCCHIPLLLLFSVQN